MTPPYRALMLTRDYPPEKGGIARMYGEIVRRLPAGSIDVSTVALSSRPPAMEEPEAVPVHRMGFSHARAKLFTSVLRWGFWADRWSRAAGVGVVLTGDVRPVGYVSAWLAEVRGIPHVLFVHGNDVWKELDRLDGSKVRRAVDARIFGGARAVLANSSATADRARELYDRLGVSGPDRVRVVHPGTDPERFTPDPGARTAWRERLGLGKEFVLLTVTRLVEYKEVATVIRAIAALPPDVDDLVYVVAGVGPDRDRLERLAGEAGVAERVRFLGFVPDEELPGLYAMSDTFVLVTRPEKGEEGFGIVFLEASACGVPVLGADANGIPDAVSHDESGLLVPPRDGAALAEAITRLARDPALRARLGGGGRARVLERFRWERAAEQVDAVLREVVSRSASRSRSEPGRR